MRYRRAAVAAAITLALAFTSSRALQADFLYANDSIGAYEPVYSGNGNYLLACVYSTTLLVTFNYVGPGTEYEVWYSLADEYFAYAGVGYHTDQWATADIDGYAVMQGDGNFVLYDSSANDVWATHTQGNSGAYLNVQDDGNLVVYDSSDSPLWSVF